MVASQVTAGVADSDENRGRGSAAEGATAGERYRRWGPRGKWEPSPHAGAPRGPRAGTIAGMSLYARIADLPVTIEHVALEPLVLETPAFARHSTVVALAGAGHVGRGEDVSYALDDQEAHRALGPLPLAGTRSLDAWSRHLDGIDLMPVEPAQHAASDYRRWAWESALLDLALRQAGLSLAAALGREARPVRFCVSSALGPAAWLEHYPEAEFKLDASDAWDDAHLAGLAALGRVRVVDLKAHYGTDFAVERADPVALLRRVAEALTDVVVEDPPTDDAAWAVLAGQEGRVAFDAPVHALAHLLALPRTGWLNVKPSRFGTARGLLETIDHCEREGIRMYGGGQFELGAGRAQIQALASVLYPDGPNDVAPAGYNATAAVPGLPTSPLPAASAAPGFGA